MKIDIDSLTVGTMRSLLADLLGSKGEPESTVRTENAAPVEESEREPIVKVKRTRRSTGQHTVYIIQDRTVDPSTLQAARAAAYKAALKADKKGKGLTESEWLAATGEPESRRKALQSPIWWLRNHDAKGNIVTPGSKKAIVINGGTR